MRANERARKKRENPKESSKEPKVRTKVPKACTKTKHRKLVSQDLKLRNRRRIQALRNLHTSVPRIFLGTMAGVMMNGLMAGVRLDGTKGWEQTYDTSASSFSLGGFALGAVSSRSGLNW